MTHEDDTPTSFGDYTDRRAHERISALEINIGVINRDLAMLANKIDSVDKSVNQFRSDLAGMRTDITWIREVLLGRVLKAESDASKANAGVGKAQDSGLVAKALGVIALLAAVIAAALGLKSPV